MGNIRKLTEKDLTLMTELYVNVFTQEPWNETWLYDNALQRLKIFISTTYTLGLGLFIEGQLRGFLLGNCEPYQKNHYFFLKEMCVDNRFQGEGIGSQLWERLEYELLVLETSSIVLNTLRGSSAEQFYRKQGCEINEDIPMMSKTLSGK